MQITFEVQRFLDNPGSHESFLPDLLSILQWGSTVSSE
jgi:hypothetical protein